MADPIKGLQQAGQPVKPAQPTSLPHQVGDAILGTSNAMLGLAGLGPDSSANRFGQMVGAGLPLMGGLHGIKAAENLVPVTEGLEPHVKALVEMLHGPPETARDPLQVFAGESVMGKRIRSPQPVTAPEGFDFGSNFSPKFAGQPKSFAEASLAGEGFQGQTGLSASNAQRQSVTQPFYAQFEKKKTPFTRAMSGGVDWKPDAPTVKSGESIQDIAPPLGGPAVQKPLIQDKTANLRGKTGRSSGSIPVSQVEPGVLEQIQRAAGTGKYTSEEIQRMFPQLSETGIRQVLKMPWNWK